MFDFIPGFLSAADTLGTLVKAASSTEKVVKAATAATAVAGAVAAAATADMVITNSRRQRTASQAHREDNDREDNDSLQQVD